MLDEAPIIDLHSDAYFMGQALREAHKARAAGEVPVGAVVTYEGRIIARAWNQVETLKDATAHAEMLALTAAQQSLGDWRLEKCAIYVTKEPCPMCAGAIVHCRPERVVFGCPDPKAGAAGGWINLLDSNPPLNHRCEVVPGIMGGECLDLLQGFFREARERKKSAITRSCGAIPKRPSTKKIIKSDSATACLVCLAISATMPVFATGSKPPVSTQMNSREVMRLLP
jgi:tRNA(adenine34) deaminase